MRIAFLLAVLLMLGENAFAQPIADLFPQGTGSSGSGIEGVDGTNDDEKFLLHYVPRLIDIIVTFVASVVFEVFVIAGIKMIISGDQQEEVEKGKKTLLYSFIGIVLVLLSYSLIRALYFFFAG